MQAEWRTKWEVCFFMLKRRESFSLLKTFDEREHKEKQINLLVCFSEAKPILRGCERSEHPRKIEISLVEEISCEDVRESNIRER